MGRADAGPPRSPPSACTSSHGPKLARPVAARSCPARGVAARPPARRGALVKEWAGEGGVPMGESREGCDADRRWERERRERGEGEKIEYDVWTQQLIVDTEDEV